MSAPDPRARLLAAAMLFCVPLCVQSPLWQLPLVVLLVAALAANRSGAALRTAAPMLALLIGVNTLVWPLFIPGTHPFAGYLTLEGVRFGAGMGLRLTACTLLGLLYLRTTPIEHTAWGLTRLGLPYAVSFGIGTAFRLLDRLARTAQTVIAAQRARGLVVGNGAARRRWRHYVPLLVPILVLSMRRVDQMAMAMESRAFKPFGPRTTLLDFSFSTADAVLLLGSAALLGAGIWLRLHGYGVLVPGRL